MRLTRSTIITGVAVLVLLAAIPSAIREALESGRIYLFSREFLADLPARLAGPGPMKQLRKLAAKRGLDPNVWFNNVELIAAEKTGRESVTCVANITSTIWPTG